MSATISLPSTTLTHLLESSDIAEEETVHVVHKYKSPAAKFVRFKYRTFLSNSERYKHCILASALAIPTAVVESIVDRSDSLI
jgi:hypothetical protein